MEKNLRSKTGVKTEIIIIKCLDCDKKYVGLTGRNFKTGYKDHINGIRKSKIKLGYSL
jgi:hypothetical protein